MRPLLSSLLLVASLAASPARAQSTPAEVVKAFYAACNDGLCSKAEKRATKESLDYIQSTFAMLGGAQGLL